MGRKAIAFFIAGLFLLLGCATWHRVPREFDASPLYQKTVFIKEFENKARTSRLKGILGAFGVLAGRLKIEDFPKLERDMKAALKAVFIEQGLPPDASEIEKRVFSYYRFPQRIDANFTFSSEGTPDYIIEGVIESALIEADLKSSPILVHTRAKVKYYLKDKKGRTIFSKTLVTEQFENISKSLTGGFLTQALRGTEAMREMLDVLKATLLENALRFYGCFVDYERFGL